MLFRRVCMVVLSIFLLGCFFVPKSLCEKGEGDGMEYIGKNSFSLDAYAEQHGLDSESEFTYWLVVGENLMKQEAERGNFVPPLDIDYEKNMVLISYGRKIASVERERVKTTVEIDGEIYYTTGSEYEIELSVVFQEEYQGRYVYFYLVEEDYYSLTTEETPCYIYSGAEKRFVKHIAELWK